MSVVKDNYHRAVMLKDCCDSKHTFKILVVEDNKDLVEVLKEQLITEKIADSRDIKVINDGREAFNFIKFHAEKLDLIILDLMLPSMDGIAILESLREDKKIKNVPIIVITAVIDEKKIQKSYQLGAMKILLKPFIVDELIKEIESIRKRATLYTLFVEIKQDLGRLGSLVNTGLVK